MEKNVSNWHPGLSKRSSMQSKIQNTSKVNKINNHMCCKLNIINTAQISEEYQINKWRYQTDYPIFRIYHFSYENHSPGRTISKVVYQLPEILLLEIARPISLSNCLYILKTILLASEKLIQQFGYFGLTQKMIGITQDKLCKIWINQNLQNNFPMLKLHYQQQTVDCIKQICQTLIRRDSLERKFIAELRKQRHNIIKLTKLIWEFSYQNSILIPPFFENNKTIYKNKNILHQKTRSLVPSPSAKKLKTQNKENITSRIRYSEDRSNSKLNKNLNKTRPQTTHCGENLQFKLNKSSQINAAKTPRERENSRSQFLNRKSLSRRNSQLSKQKQNLTKTTTSKQTYQLNQKIKNNYKINSNTNSNNFSEQQETDEKIKKMKNMVKQKIRLNREKKKVIKLQAINTVKSIGQFTESQKRILEENGQTNDNKNNVNLQLLNMMCNKIGKSQFSFQQVQYPEDLDQSKEVLQN